MDILLINLDRSADRLDAMRLAFEHHGLGFTRIPAVDGREISQAQLAFLNPTLTLSGAELAVLLSHRKCWELIISEGLPHAAIFEDDVILSTDAAVVLEDLGAVASSLGIIKIEIWPERKAPLKIGRVATGRAMLKPLGGVYLGSAGYIVSRDAAARLLDASRTPTSPIDHFMFNPMAVDFCKLMSWQLTNPICVQMMFVPDSLGAGSSLVTAERKRFRTKTSGTRFKVAGIRKNLHKFKNRLARLIGLLNYVDLPWPDPDLKIVARRR